MAGYKVLLTTSGTGSRLGELTKYTNKALVRVGKKPAISYIVEAYPEDVEFVVTLGYFGNQIRDFLELAYPNRKFTFVEINPYEGPKSSLLFSMLCARKELQCPFIFHACDTLTTNKIPEPTENWCVGFKDGNNSSQYRTHNVYGNHLQRINDKGELRFDRIHIGLIGIYDYEVFWSIAWNIYQNSPEDTQLSDCHAINSLISIKPVRSILFTSWLDIGNLDTLSKSRELISDKFHILDKVDESIFIFDKFVIKFFYDEKMVTNRIARTSFLGNSIPKILGTKPNFYKYEYVEGTVFSDVADIVKFNKLLKWLGTNLWTGETYSKDNFNKAKEFYFTKTRNRVDKFLKDNNVEDKTITINGLECPTVNEMLNQISEDDLCKQFFTHFHGDLILDNIIYTDSGDFKLIDWRQDFAGSTEWGDIQYDFAKLNHNLVFNHDIVNRKLFTIEINGDNIRCDIHRKNTLVECQAVLKQYVGHRACSYQTVELLTPIIWLNMAALHEYPINMFLFYFGKYNLRKTLLKYESNSIHRSSF